MANASAGEPLALRHGVALWSAQTTYGTPVTPATSAGICMVGHTKRSSNQSFYGPGSPNFLARKGGSTYTEWNIRMPAVQTGHKTLVQRAAFASGVVPLTTLGFGYSDDQGTPNRSADQIQDAKIGSLRLGLDASGGHGPLTADLSGIGGLVTAVTSLAPATLVTTPFMTYEGIFTRAAAAYEIRSFEVNLENNLSRDHVIYGATQATFPRGHKYLTEHNQTISGRISRYQRSGADVFATPIAQAAMVLTLTNTVDAATLILTFADVDFDNEELSEDENGLIWSFDFTAKTLAIT